MNLEQQCCSLELAKRLKELGVKQESIFYWGTWGGGFVLGDVEDKGEWPDIPDTYFSAFTVSELGEMLPAGSFGVSCIRYSEPDARTVWDAKYYEDGEVKQGESSEKEADARAMLLIYLIENKKKTRLQVKVSCNKCGAGKKLYWSDLQEIKRFDAIVTKALFEKTDIRSTLYVQDIKKGCPKCGGELTPEL